MNDQSFQVMSHMNQLYRVYDAALAWHKSPKDMTPNQREIFTWMYKAGIR